MKDQELITVLGNGLISAQKAIDELFAELGNKRAGDWGVINDNLVKVNKALKLYQWGQK